MIEVTVYFTEMLQPPVKVLMEPEDWDRLLSAGIGFLDDTDQERVIDVLKVR